MSKSQRFDKNRKCHEDGQGYDKDGHRKELHSERRQTKRSLDEYMNDLKNKNMRHNLDSGEDAKYQ